MSTFEILLVIYGAILAAAALGVVYRMVVGPTILDRAISSDSLVTLVVMGMALYAAHAQVAWAGPALLGLTGLAFIGTVTFARFVAREDQMQGRRSHHLSEPSTDTGPHEAIHPDPASDETWDAATDRTPGNHFLSAETHGPLPAEGQDAPESAPSRKGELPHEDAPSHEDEPPRQGELPREGGRTHPGPLLGPKLSGDPFTDRSRTAESSGTGTGTEDEHGFGAQAGSRGFEYERHRAPDDETTEEQR